MTVAWNWWLDGWIIVAGVLCATASALVGTFLVLRRMSLLGDAISHAVLPGLAAAFMLSGSRNSISMFIGAVIVGVLTALGTQWIRDYGKVDEGASMGVVFTSFFALGLVMIVQAADRVDLDPGCVLYGAIELTPLDTWKVIGFEVPRVVINLAIVCILNALFVALFYKELKLTSFDPALATTAGIRASTMHYALMTLVAVTAVASFESVGNILVIAMMIVPAATALLLSSRLSIVILLSVLVGGLSAVVGHVVAVFVPNWFGMRSVTTAGSMATVLGSVFLFVCLFAPHNGILVKWCRSKLLSMDILAEDVLALLFRDEERGGKGIAIPQLTESLHATRFSIAMVVRRHHRIGNIALSDRYITLTEEGRIAARNLVRSHRLWEHYLQDQASVPTSRLHAKAERLEHFTDEELRTKLARESQSPTTDPHGRSIPH